MPEGPFGGPRPFSQNKLSVTVMVDGGIDTREGSGLSPYAMQKSTAVEDRVGSQVIPTRGNSVDLEEESVTIHINDSRISSTELESIKDIVSSIFEIQVLSVTVVA